MAGDAPTSAEDHDERGDRRRLWGLIGAGVAVAAVIALLVVGLANRGQSTRIPQAVAAGERPPAPEISLPVLVPGAGLGPRGATASLSELRGTPVVLNIWASWCEPCKTESPLLESVWRSYRDRGVVVLGLDTQDLTEQALSFVRQYGLTYPSLRDPGDGARNALGATGVPETFIIDRQGRVAAHIVGEVTRPEQITTPLRQVL
jgi:cytochrome c biogenesis protein CcmG/thiol:disulfide interchange protein DsbE